mmetsp:Transcript_11685/g.9346  ORF Transcript_11685/g.9346 Transcript_11685/m.9346 type:complete len:147 (+) Transcript_11685:123-563(+)
MCPLEKTSRSTNSLYAPPLVPRSALHAQCLREERGLRGEVLVLDAFLEAEGRADLCLVPAVVCKSLLVSRDDSWVDSDGMLTGFSVLQRSGLGLKIGIARRGWCRHGCAARSRARPPRGVNKTLERRNSNKYLSQNGYGCCQRYAT